MAISSQRDANRIPALIATSNADGVTVLPVYVDSVTNRLLVQATISGSFTVTVASDGATGSAVPASASYGGINVAGTLRGATGVNPSGSIYATQVDISSIAGTTTATGNGVVSAGVQRVAIASDNTAFSVNATLSAETTKVIGVVRTADGSGNLLTSTTNALDVNLKTSGLSNLSTNVAQMNGVAVSMGSGINGTGVQRVTLATDQAAVSTAGLFSVKIDQTTPGTTNLVAVSSISTSVTPGTAAANLGKAEDAAHASGDTGVFVLGVRNDNGATTYGADQDYGPLATDKNGRNLITSKAPTGTQTSVASSASNVTLLAANSARLGATLYNDSTQICYVRFSATATTSNYSVQLLSNSYYEVPFGYTGIIDGIWASANGNMRVTEMT